MSLKLKLAGLAVAGLVLGASITAHAVPDTLTHQGRLFDDTGTPVEGSLSVAFSIYAVNSGGSNIWTETQNVTFDNGYFAAELGGTTALTTAVFDGSVLYLGIAVGGDPEMIPRLPIRSVPYAIAAGSIDLRRVAGTASVASSNSTGTVSCPADHVVTGGGCQIAAAGTATLADVNLKTSSPATAADAWTCTCVTPGGGDTCTVTATAMCVPGALTPP